MYVVSAFRPTQPGKKRVELQLPPPRVHTEPQAVPFGYQVGGDHQGPGLWALPHPARARVFVSKIMSEFQGGWVRIVPFALSCPSPPLGGDAIGVDGSSWVQSPFGTLANFPAYIAYMCVLYTGTGLGPQSDVLVGA